MHSPFSAIDAAFAHTALPLPQQALHLRRLAVRLFEQDEERFLFNLSLKARASQVYSDGNIVHIAARGASEAAAALGSYLSEYAGRSIDALVDGRTAKLLHFPPANYTHKRLDRSVSRCQGLFLVTCSTAIRLIFSFFFLYLKNDYLSICQYCIRPVNATASSSVRSVSAQ